MAELMVPDGAAPVAARRGARSAGARAVPTPAGSRVDTPFCRRLARLAVRSLYAELVLYPKPGLVSPVDDGSHADMSAATFMRSMFALRRYFLFISEAGMDDAPFHVLKRLGIEAEARMLRATGGINTHRGAIFCLGMLCAAIGRCRAKGTALTPAAIQATLLIHWGRELGAHSDPCVQAGVQAPQAASHGLAARRRYAASGAREEGACGFPSVFGVGLPVLQASLAAGRGLRRARIDALFALMAHISDTNVYHRGGIAGAQTVRRLARAFVAAGGTAAPDWEVQALACHHRFVAARLSPGGAADLLGAACLLQAVCGALD